MSDNERNILIAEIDARVAELERLERVVKDVAAERDRWKKRMLLLERRLAKIAAVLEGAKDT